AGEAPAAREARSRDDLSLAPVEDVARRVHDRERGDDDVAQSEAGAAEAALHAAGGLRAQHSSNRRTGARPDVAFRDGAAGRRLARLVGGLGIRTDPRIAEREVVDHGARDDRDSYVAAPVESAPLILEIANHPGVSGQSELTASAQEQPVNGLDGADGL